MRVQLLLALVLLGSSAFAQSDTTTTTTAAPAPNIVEDGWNNLVSSTTGFWGNLMGWGAPPEPETTTPEVVTTEATTPGTTFPSSTTLATTMMGITAVEDDLDEGLDFGESIFSFLMVFLPNMGIIMAGVFGAWIQVFAGFIMRNILSPVFTVLGSAFNIPLENGLFDIGTIVVELGSFIAMPFAELTSMAVGGFQMGMTFVEPITNCLLSTINASKEMLFAMFQVFPACITEATFNVVTIIVDTFAMIENLSTLFSQGMDVLNNVAVNPLMAIIKLITETIWSILWTSVQVSRGAQALVELIPHTGSAAASCLANQSTELMMRMPNITSGFVCRF